MRKWMWFLSLFIMFFSPFIFAAEKALVIHVNEAIGPATQDYVKRAIVSAEKQHKVALIIQLNTPGGLETSMRGINEAITNSHVPVVIYVAPTGARAASAGTFMLYASHFAAMAPGTNVGAASPINLVSSSQPGDKKEKSTEEVKATNDAAAYMRSLAELRGRNAEWGVLAVQKASSISAEEAKRLKVIDEIAENYPDLLKKMDGHSVNLHGVPTKLNTKNLELENMQPDWRHQFLSFITNPNIVYILMLVAIYGLFFEMSNPGLVLPGVAGIIALLLVLYAFQLMPINYAGLTLLLIGIAFMVFEVYVSSFGVIGIGGVIAFILGSVMLFDTNDPYFHLTWTLILAMSLLSLAFFFMVLNLAFRSHKKAIVTGAEGLIGSEGVVLSRTPEEVIVRVLGEIWEAQSEPNLKPGQRIKVVRIDGLKLIVEPVKENEERRS